MSAGLNSPRGSNIDAVVANILLYTRSGVHVHLVLSLISSWSLLDSTIVKHYRLPLVSGDHLEVVILCGIAVSKH
jgi:hypothetical protein